MTERREEGDDGAALRPFGVAFVDPMFAMTERKEESYEGDLIKCLGSFLALLVDSQAAIMDEALLVEANNHPFSMLFFFRSFDRRFKVEGARWVIGAFSENGERNISFRGQNLGGGSS